jgi:hypothetical protein
MKRPVKIDHELFKTLTQWGHVNAGTMIVDNEGQRYVVESQNAAGFLRIGNLSGGESHAFEVLDYIDHAKYSVPPSENLPKSDRSEWE